jgi:hypothetical protein
LGFNGSENGRNSQRVLQKWDGWKLASRNAQWDNTGFVVARCSPEFIEERSGSERTRQNVFITRNADGRYEGEMDEG